MQNLIGSITGIVITLIIWQTLFYFTRSPILIDIRVIYQDALALVVTPAFWNNLGSSMQIMAAGYTISVVFGMGISVLVYNVKVIRQIVEPIINSLRNVAAVSLIPIFIVTLGIEKAKVVTVFWTAWTAITLNALYGYTQIEPDVIDASQIDGCTPWQTFYYMRLPLAKNAIITGMTIGLTGGWISLVTAETIGSTKGLGYAIIQNTQLFRYGTVYVYILIIALVSYGTIKLISNIGDKNDEKN